MSQIKWTDRKTCTFTSGGSIASNSSMRTNRITFGHVDEPNTRETEGTQHFNHGKMEFCLNSQWFVKCPFMLSLDFLFFFCRRYVLKLNIRAFPTNLKDSAYHHLQPSTKQFYECFCVSDCIYPNIYVRLWIECWTEWEQKNAWEYGVFLDNLRIAGSKTDCLRTTMWE